MNYQKLFIAGRLTKDPELKATPSGQSVCQFGAAVNRVYTDKEGKRQEEAEYFNVVAFGKLADITQSLARKGTLIFLEGRLKTRAWKDKEGNDRKTTEVIAETIQFAPKAHEEIPKL